MVFLISYILFFCCLQAAIISILAVDNGLALKIFDAEGKLYFDSTVESHSKAGKFSCESRRGSFLVLSSCKHDVFPGTVVAYTIINFDHVDFPFSSM